MAEPLLIISSFFVGTVVGMLFGAFAVKKYLEQQAKKQMEEALGGMNMNEMDFGGLNQDGDS